MDKRERRELKRKHKREAIARQREAQTQARAAAFRAEERDWEEQELLRMLDEASRAQDARRATGPLRRLVKLRPDRADYWAMLLGTSWAARDESGEQEETARSAMALHPGEPFFRMCAAAARFKATGAESAWSEFLEAHRAPSRIPVHRPFGQDLLRELLPLERRRQKAPPRSARPAPEAKASAEAPPSPRPAPPPPLPEVEIPLQIVPPSFDGLAEALLRGRDTIEDASLAEAAVDLMLADQYDRLLCLDAVQGVEHLPHQIETVTKALRKFHGRVLLSDEVGLGKTIEAGLVLKEYLMRGQVKRALVICPPALVSQWESELSEKFGIECVTTSRSLYQDDADGFCSQGPVLVVSLGVIRSPRHRERLAEQNFDMLILDEAHHLKNRATRGYQVVSGLKSRYLLMLTATPVETDLRDLYNIVTLLRPGTLGTEAEFRRRFVNAHDPAAPKDAEGLRSLLSEVMIRNTRAVSGVRLPPRTARTIVVPMSEEERTLYGQLLGLVRGASGKDRTLVRLLLEEAGSSPDAVAATLAEVARSDGREPRLSEALAEAASVATGVPTTGKVSALAKLLPGGKVLVFTRFRATFDRIAAELASQGMSFTPFHGGLTGRERDASVEAFAGPIDVMLCSEVGGEGKNLQFCHRIINFDLPWNPMKIEQRIGRVHRIGQKESVEIVNLCAGGTIEERILEVLDQRINLFELVVGEMDLMLGDIEEEKEFGERVLDIYAEAESESQVEEGFERLADKLKAARGRFERTRALDEALFGNDYAG